MLLAIHVLPFTVYLLSPQRNVTSLDQFVAMKDTERRLLVRALSDEEYYNVMAVCSMFPHVELNTDMHGGWGNSLLLLVGAGGK